MGQVTTQDAVLITLPRLVGTRGAAERLVEATVGSRVGAVVELFGRNVVDASPSFINGLVEQLQERRAREIVLYPSPPEFIEEFSAAAKKHELLGWRMATDDELGAL